MATATKKHKSKPWSLARRRAQSRRLKAYHNSKKRALVKRLTRPAESIKGVVAQGLRDMDAIMGRFLRLTRPEQMVTINNLTTTFGNLSRRDAN